MTVKIIDIATEVLARLAKIGYEKQRNISIGQLIFPAKSDVVRISEQELRQIFIEVFKEKHQDLYYSIETPTINKYSFGKSHLDIRIGGGDIKGRSALIDMCVFEKENDESEYKRILNIEFKYVNANFKNFSKDILKLMYEKENGVFILLLKNTDSGSLNNGGEIRRGVIDKLTECLESHKEKDNWNGSEQKNIEVFILSLEITKNKGKSPFLCHGKIFKSGWDPTLNWEKWNIDRQ